MAKKRLVLHLTLRDEITESPAGLSLFKRKEQTALYDILRLLRKAAESPKIAGLLLSIKQLNLGWAQAEEIKKALSHFEDREKPVYVYFEQPDNLGYYLVSNATKVFLPPAATLDLVGLRGEVFFFQKLFEALGIEAELFNVGEYKSAAEMFQRMSYSAASRKMTESILSELHGRLVSAVVSRTRATKENAIWLIDQGPFTAKRAKENSLIDGISYEDQVEELVKEELHVKDLMPASKFPLGEGLIKRLLTFRRPQIAVIEAEGMISTGESRRGQGRWPILGSRTLLEQLQDTRKRKRIKAVVLRINSPGGSGLASDLIWREVKLTDEKKPLIVSFGNVSASGGYYIATGGRMILADSNTLTGSIGVIGGKFNIKGLLQELGITTDHVDQGRRAGYTSVTRPFRRDESEAFQEQLTEFYEELFLNRVSQNRCQAIEQVRKAAEGRVWTGSQALEMGLIDQIGGISEAVSVAKRTAGIEDRKVRLVIYTPRKSLRDLLPVQLEYRFLRERIFAIAPFLPRIR